MTTPTKLDLALIIQTALGLLMSRLSAGPRNTPLQEIIDSKQRVDDAMQALRTLSNSSIGTEPAIASLETQNRFLTLPLIASEIRFFLYSRMKGVDYQIVFFGTPLMMKNLIDCKTYEMLCKIVSSKQNYYIALNEHGQYIFSEDMYWQAAV